ncbi:MAG: pyridoxal 5-phosphate synthase pdxT subunit, partial [Miltoncostaeaceae bacterium]|nr:pyridoxal 5-phosphate synthase pdxT subunit [Miltoncostaeaceae bacterium]
LAAVGADPVQVRRPEELEGLDGLVLPGGESTTVGLVAQRTGLLPALRAAIVEQALPVFGTCAGLIMLARETTGGAQPLIGGLDLVVRRNAFGRQAASFEAELEVPALGPQPVPGVFIRAPWIEWAGPGVEVLASHRGHIVAARQGDRLVTAFHPELTGDRRFHASFVDGLRRRRERREEERAKGRLRVRAQ